MTTAILGLALLMQTPVSLDGGRKTAEEALKKLECRLKPSTGDGKGSSVSANLLFSYFDTPVARLLATMPEVDTLRLEQYHLIPMSQSYKESESIAGYADSKLASLELLTHLKSVSCPIAFDEKAVMRSLSSLHGLEELSLFYPSYFARVFLIKGRHPERKIKDVVALAKVPAQFELSGDAARSLKKLKRLRSIRLSDVMLSDEFVREFTQRAESANVEWSMTVRNTSLSPEFFATHRRIGNLCSIRIQDAEPSGVSERATRLTGLSSLSRLKELTLATLDQNLTNDMRDEIRKLRSLKVLRFIPPLPHGTPITSSEIALFNELESLERLELEAAYFKEKKCLSKLSPAIPLRELRLCAHITDEELLAIPQLSHLRKLDLYLGVDSKVTVEGIRRLLELPALEELEVTGSSLSERDRQSLKKAKPRIVVRFVPRPYS